MIICGAEKYLFSKKCLQKRTIKFPWKVHCYPFTRAWLWPLSSGTSWTLGQSAAGQSKHPQSSCDEIATVSFLPTTPSASRHFESSWLRCFLISWRWIPQRSAKNHSSLQFCQHKAVRWIITTLPWRKSAPSISSKCSCSFQKVHCLLTAPTFYSLWFLWRSRFGPEIHPLETGTLVTTASPVDDYSTVTGATIQWLLTFSPLFGRVCIWNISWKQTLYFWMRSFGLWIWAAKDFSSLSNSDWKCQLLDENRNLLVPYSCCMKTDSPQTLRLSASEVVKFPFTSKGLTTTKEQESHRLLMIC